MASLTPIKPGDIVEVDRKGRFFFAVVVRKLPGLLDIRPLDSRITYTTAKANEVVSQYRKTKNCRQVSVRVDSPPEGVAH